MKQRWQAFEPGERVALILFVLLTASILLHDLMMRTIWLLWIAPLAFLWGTAVLLALFNIAFALRSGAGLARIVRGAIAIPVALLVATLLGLSGVGRITAASAYLYIHRDEMSRAQAVAGPGEPAALRYIEGVPDGGVAIIRSPVPPRALPVEVQLRLTGERIHVCRAILFSAYACSYD